MALEGFTPSRPSLGYFWTENKGSEVDSQAFAFPVAIADRFKAFGTAEFGREWRGGRGIVAGLGFGKGAFGCWRQVGAWCGHRAILGNLWAIV